MTFQLFTLASTLALVCLVPAIVAGGQDPGEAAAQDEHGEHHGQHHGSGHQHGAAGSEVDVHRPGMKHDFSDVDKWAKGFDDPERLVWQKPDHVVELMKIEPGMTVADIGAGTGFLEPYLAGAVGAKGKVLALDVEPKMVEHMTSRAREAGLTQVEARLVDPADPGLAPGSVDRIVIVNTWHHIDDRGPYSAKLLGALRPGGTIYVVDFEKASGKGPPPDHKLAPNEVIVELEAGGLAARQVEEDLPEQYVVAASSR